MNNEIETKYSEDKERRRQALLLDSQGFTELIQARVKPLIKEKLSALAIKKGEGFDESVLVRAAVLRLLREECPLFGVPLGFLGGNVALD